MAHRIVILEDASPLDRVFFVSFIPPCGPVPEGASEEDSRWPPQARAPDRRRWPRALLPPLPPPLRGWGPGGVPFTSAGVHLGDPQPPFFALLLNRRRFFLPLGFFSFVLCRHVPPRGASPPVPASVCGSVECK